MHIFGQTCVSNMRIDAQRKSKRLSPWAVSVAVLFRIAVIVTAIVALRASRTESNASEERPSRILAI